MKNNTTDNLVKAINKLIALDAKYRAIHNLKETARDWDMAIDIAKKALTAYEQELNERDFKKPCNVLNRGNKVVMKDGLVLTIKTLEETEFTSVEMTGYIPKKNIDRVLNEREQTEGETKEEILSEVSGVPLAFIKDGTYTYFESSWIYESMQLWGDQQTAPLLKRIEELERVMKIDKASLKAITHMAKEKDKLIEELEKENEMWKKYYNPTGQ